MPSTLPEYLTNPDFILGDIDASWRYGKPPDYSKTRNYFNETKTMNHEAGSLPDLVQNLVKNWEIEASFKTKLSEWKTISPEEYSFSINGRAPQSGEEMLRVGTYNAIIQPGNEFYSPQNSDFAQSHKTFKRMMPTFAWEVLDVIGAPPVVGIKWRHWGVMKDDYTGFNDKGERVTAKAHGGLIELLGTTWAWVDDQVRVKKLETWFDPLEMFRQIAPNGIINKETVQPEKVGINVDGADGVPMNDFHSGATGTNTVGHKRDDKHESHGVDGVNGTGLEKGEAVALPADDPRAQEAHAEMSSMTRGQCPFMNAE